MNFATCFPNRSSKWVDFKVIWDMKLSKLYAKDKDKNFYCTWCGIKCKTDWSRKDYSVKFQKCVLKTNVLFFIRLGLFGPKIKLGNKTASIYKQMQ